MIERFVPGAGGVENVAWQVAHELVRQGEEVRVITRSSPANSGGESSASKQVSLSGSCTSGRGETHENGALSVDRLSVSTLWQPFRVLAFSRRAHRATTNGAFDIVHSFARTRHQDLYRAGGGSHADYLRRLHSPAARALRQFSPRHRVLLDIEKRIFADPVQRIQCASRLVANALVRDHGVSSDRIHLLPNAVDADWLNRPHAIRNGARLRTDMMSRNPETNQLWLFPGSGWRRKGLDTLLRSLAKRRDPGLRLWVAGRDAPRPWVAQCRRMGLADRVDFIGERKDLDAIYHAVDGVVLPTRYDAFANATLEAAAAGLPVITSAANGASEWLGEGAVTLPDPEDVGDLCRAFDSLGQEEARIRVGRNAAAVARSLDWPAHAAALRDLYRDILADRTRRSEMENHAYRSPGLA